MSDAFTPHPPPGAERRVTADPPKPHADEHGLDTEFKRGLGLFDATMVVVGSMIGSGIFIVSAEMSRLVGSPGWLLVAWAVTGVLTVTAALSYGELAALMPRAGGQYVYLREAFSPLWGFLYGWTLFLVIQTGTIAAVGVAFAKFAGVLWPTISESNYLIAPVQVVPGYAVSLSTAQLLAVVMIALLTATNVFGLDYGKFVQNLFTVSKTGALIAKWTAAKLTLIALLVPVMLPSAVSVAVTDCQLAVRSVPPLVKACCPWSAPVKVYVPGWVAWGSEVVKATVRRRLTPVEWLLRAAIVDALRAHAGNKELAAASLGMSRASIYRKIKSLDIDVPSLVRD